MIEQLEKRAEELTEVSKRMRLDAIDMALAAGNSGAHLGGSLSCIEIMAVLYGAILKYDVNNPEWEKRDRFFISKNHCTLAHFPALAEAGFIEKSELKEFKKDGGRLTGYPRNVKVGLEYSGGSLGMAISVAIGVALASREKQLDNNIYVLMGDGELNEGSIWEAFMSASQYKLDNITAIIDRNHLSYDGDTEEVMALEDLGAKLSSFGWNVIKCNGHSTFELLKAFEARKKGMPNIIIADTIKGKGVSFAENQREWHHGSITTEQYELARKEILGGVE